MTRTVAVPVELLERIHNLLDNYITHFTPEEEELRTLLAEQPGKQVPVEFDYPEFHAVAMGCGLEDRGITDRYEAMRYGYDEAVDQFAHIIESLGPLYAAPVAQAGQVPEEWRKALEFYAKGDHLLLADPDAWDTCSGEPMNWLHDEAGTASVEDGSFAKQALAAAPAQEVEKPDAFEVARHSKRLVEQLRAKVAELEERQASRHIGGIRQAGQVPEEWRDMLASLQWHYRDHDDHWHRPQGYYCPQCGGEKDKGHEEHCKLAALLAAAPAQGGES
ncbi:hypothetical protein A6723_019465 [Pseudomonas sp. AU11447]|uniref:hypothetical protein n=1 Tax=unclassified Pseudomonas TaxID=196821 RepID=UPI0006D3BE7F|nr:MULTISPECIES: hypothetical protein [unclassified Pseudomonas]OBY90491.1 hypothetical protein A6723_019465 [Pseudomonas sp. AU11447]